MTVQQGFVVPNASLLPDTQDALMNMLAETNELAVAMGTGTHDLTVQSGVLQGRDVAVTVTEDGTTSTYVEGGMWIVKGMWTVGSPVRRA